MISPEYCQMMAQYNAWQNSQMKSVLEKLTEADLRADRGAFFGSIMATANHLLWGDLLWMARFDGGEAPTAQLADSGQTTPTMAVWGAERFRTDGRIKQWASALTQDQMSGDLSWMSASLGREVSRPISQCIVHFFNHQTHHRGQIHTMVTSLGMTTGDTDLVFMPED
ncbi:damage-inducible protein DinB [Shimia litoralis]|uniref:Damage-inducible protein DinB n=1 Tax=Shimia litoralis TaxID=420403 RepID=A0A4U7N4Q1_9RHOB|nr:DinB family protein [Shimia litoralis]TKZ20760.1 damage-inducible protein DinB [Shimia litoralis]